jgi:hypothetical protein
LKNFKRKRQAFRLDWDGMIFSNPENLVLDKIWKLKEVEKKIQFKKGLFCGLEISRESNNSLWELSKSQVVLLQSEQMKILKEIDKINPDVLLCLFALLYRANSILSMWKAARKTIFRFFFSIYVFSKNGFFRDSFFYLWTFYPKTV